MNIGRYKLLQGSQLLAVLIFSAKIEVYIYMVVVVVLVKNVTCIFVCMEFNN